MYVARRTMDKKEGKPDQSGWHLTCYVKITLPISESTQQPIWHLRNKRICPISILIYGPILEPSQP